MSESAVPRSGERRAWRPYEEAYPDLSWNYTHFNEPQLTAKLEEISTWGTFADTDYATIQPSTNPDEASQDRHVIQDWEIDGKRWNFRAIFDGHGGHDTADYTVAAFPTFLLDRLSSRLRGSSKWVPSDISALLARAISDFDDGLGTSFLDLFPGDSIHQSSDEQVKKIVNYPANLAAVLRCMRGTTVLVSLFDPDSANLWVASLGDCTAILGTREPNGAWLTQTLSHNHNGENPAESARVILEHHGEQDCIEADRVLGAIAVTRAVGDFVFKLPSIFTQRALLSCDVGFRTSKKVEDLLPRIITPPYVSNVPQVTHTSLTRSLANGESEPSSFSVSSPQHVLLMFSDGLGDLYEDEFRNAPSLPGFWGEIMKHVMQKSHHATNAALGFIRVGLGGSDPERVSRLLTTEYHGRWMDDTTVLVHRL